MQRDPPEVFVNFERPEVQINFERQLHGVAGPRGFDVSVGEGCDRGNGTQQSAGGGQGSTILTMNWVLSAVESTEEGTHDIRSLIF